jgi:hypothetical protein
MKTKYAAVPQRGITDAEAQSIGEELSALGDNYTPDVVWKAARNPESAMHRFFTWDRDQASEERWYEQARYLIRSIVDVSRGGIRAFHSIVTEDEEGNSGHVYVPIRILRADKTAADQVIQNLMRELLSLNHRLALYPQVFGLVISAIQKTKKGKINANQRDGRRNGATNKTIPGRRRNGGNSGRQRAKPTRARKPAARRSRATRKRKRKG